MTGAIDYRHVSILWASPDYAPELAQLHAGVRRQTCERHTICLHVQDVAPVFRRTTPKLIVSNLLGMETKLHLPP